MELLPAVKATSDHSTSPHRDTCCSNTLESETCFQWSFLPAASVPISTQATGGMSMANAVVLWNQSRQRQLVHFSLVVAQLYGGMIQKHRPTPSPYNCKKLNLVASLVSPWMKEILRFLMIPLVWWWPKNKDWSWFTNALKIQYGLVAREVVLVQEGSGSNPHSALKLIFHSKFILVQSWSWSLVI